jgi:hypothetical protein
MNVAQGLIGAIVPLLLTAGAGAARQDGFRIEALTVPAPLLPAGCRLAPDKAKGDPSFMMYPSLRQNPWTGSGVSAASIRRVVDGPLSSDGSASAARQQAAEQGIVDAYRARYLERGGSPVEVYAVHFNDPSLTAPSALARLGQRPGRTIVIGNTAVWVSPGKGGDCYRAVTAYIASLR